MNAFSQEPAWREMPYSLEAEQSVLGGIMLAGRAALDEVSDLVTEESFLLDKHRLIFRAIRALAEHAKRFDPVNLGDWLKRKGFADEIEKGAYLVELASTTPSAANVRYYAEIVADKALRRRVIEAGNRIVDAGFGLEDDTLDVVGQAQTLVGDLLQAQPSEVAPISEAMDAAFEDLSERHERGDGMDGLPTGYAEYDDILGGLVPGVHFLAGRPKHGKSTLAQNIAEFVALKLRKPVHIVILEMSEKQYAKRVIASVGGVDSQRMRRGTLDDADWAGVSEAVRKTRGAPLFISKPGTTRIEHICAQIRKQHAKTRLGLAVLDYLQLVEIVTARGENYSTAVGRVTRALVNLAQELSIPILCLSQLSREADEGEPKPKHLRDSGAIEADAESVTFVHREEMNDPRSKFAGTVKVIVALNRNGPPGTFRLLFRGEKYRCENLPYDWEAPPEEIEPKPKRRGFRKGGNPGADAAAGGP